MSDKYNVVIIGTGSGGLTIAHHLLKNIFPALSKSTGRSYRITLLSPSFKFFHRVSAPRALINPHSQALDAGLKDIRPGLEAYGEQASLVLGLASSIDHATRTVTYDGAEGASNGSLVYDALIIASGADAVDGGEYWGVTCGEERLRAAYEHVHNRIEASKTILIAGGGPVGVETAGEILDRFPNGEKEITLYSGATRLLAGIDNQAFGRDAETKLVAKGAKVVHGVRVIGTTRNADGTMTVRLDDDESKTADLYLPSSGLKPNSRFVPRAWLNEKGLVKCDPRSFRLEAPEAKNVYAFGSVASYSDGTLFDIKFAYKTLGETFKVDQTNETGGSLVQKSFYSKWQHRNLQFTPIGKDDGVVVLLGWRLPGFLCVLVKSRTFFVEQTPEYTHGKGI